MKTIKIWLVALSAFTSSCLCAITKDVANYDIVKYTLDNGLTVLVKPNANKDYVSMRLFIRVGSSDDADGHKGIAHMLEHTLFKGTDTMSEADLKEFCQKFQCQNPPNADTSADRTCFKFDLPVDSWRLMIPILADVFTHASLKQSSLYTELNPILSEERKMGLVWPVMLKTLFSGHPYQSPVIGYPEDIINTTADDIKAVYKKYYVPNNAVLVVVGNVDPQEVETLAKTCFGPCKADLSYTKSTFSIDFDQKGHAITIGDDTPVTYVSVMWKFRPHEDNSVSRKLLRNFFLKKGISPLHTKLVTQENLVQNIRIYDFDDTPLYQADLLEISFTPYDEKDIARIIQYIQEELARLAKEGFDETVLKSYLEHEKVNFLHFLENNADQAEQIGESFLKFGNEYLPYRMITDDVQCLNDKIKTFVAQYFIPDTMHTFIMRPFTQEEKKAYQEKLRNKDAYQAQHLDDHATRSSGEVAVFTKNMEVRQQGAAVTFTPQEAKLSNGIDVVFVAASDKPFISFQLLHKADERYVRIKHTGLGLNTMFSVLAESGTTSKSLEDIKKEAYRLDCQYDMNASGLGFRTRAENFEASLRLVSDFIFHPNFKDSELERIKKAIVFNDKAAWNDSGNIVDRLQNYSIMGKRSFLDFDALNKFSVEEFKTLYPAIMVPNKAALVIVGDLSNYPNLIEILEGVFGSWKKVDHDCMDDPDLLEMFHENRINFNHYGKHLTEHANIDNAEVRIFGPSFKLRKKQCFNDRLALELYTEHLHERFMELRQKDGLFYNGGAGVMVRIDSFAHWVVTTDAVEPSRTEEAIKAFKQFIKDDIERFSQEDLDKALAKRAEEFSHVADTSDTVFEQLIMLKNGNLPYDFYASVLSAYQKISLQDIKAAVRKHVDLEKANVIVVGRKGAVDRCSQTYNN